MIIYRVKLQLIVQDQEPGIHLKKFAATIIYASYKCAFISILKMPSAQRSKNQIKTM